MATRPPTGSDSELNMTPMIDVVFQLIVFFLLSLKFKAVDQRIDSYLPKTVGTDPSPFILDEPMLTVKLFRQEADDPERAYTTIRIGNRYTFDLPRGRWTGRGEEDQARQGEYARVMEDVRAAIADMWDRMGHKPDLKGRIATPPPKGLHVPHGDVVQVLDAFLRAGLTDVAFEGARAPIPSRGGTVTGG